MSLSQVAKASREQLERKKRDAQIGFANNAFGAAAGAYGTKAVWREQRAKHYPARDAALKAKRAARAAARKPGVLRRTGSAMRATVVSRTPAKVKRFAAAAAIPAAVGTAVGSQLVNAAMDAQSAQYFAREIKDMRAKEARLSKSDGPSVSDVYVSESPRGTGHGRRLEATEPVSKKVRRFDAEADRQRRLGDYEGAGFAGGGALLAGGAAIGSSRGKELLASLALTPAQKKAWKAGRGRLLTPTGLLAGGAGLAAMGAAARHRATQARNERWT